MPDTIDIVVNGELSNVKTGSTVATLLHGERIMTGRFLVVVNDEVVSKSAYAETVLNAGDRVDIMSAITGG
ncbi:MAG: sulfur carrier protein ThiS [Gammaproteobacteria bacterium]|nr:sulfur carrier protein ThiS [Gammaproteobacteria bacterium]MDT8371038.1 sulfur carrier protein ThiS [Gammaproteobacteria bacterium]